MDVFIFVPKKSTNLRRISYILFGFLVLILLNGCATTNTVKQVDNITSLDENARVLLFTPDVKYYLLTTGGVPQPHAEWTESARDNFKSSFLSFAINKGMEVISLPEDSELSDIEIQYKDLYTAVGSSILTHHLGQAKLPTKKGSFDWTLGPGISVIGDKYDVDYALFSYYRDYQASGGRVAYSFMAALVGVGVITGIEVGYASLIDLRTGDVIWFNRVTSGVGELRNRDEAKEVIELLFKDLPAKF